MYGLPALTLVLLFSLTVDGKNTINQKNILFIAADDMRPEIGAFSDKDRSPPLFPHMHTPNIDALASKSLVLKRAYVQQPLCAPSRASILTGRRPDTTRVHGFHKNFREIGGNFTTIPQFFKEKGYETIGLGKIFHESMKELWNDDPISWSKPVWHGECNHENRTHSWLAVPEDQLVDAPLRDQQLSQKAIETLRELAPAAKSMTKNFFLGVGYKRPHLPFVFPRAMLDFYPEESIFIPEATNLHVPRHMPKIGWSDYTFLLRHDDIKAINITGDFNTVLPIFKIKELRRAYYSSVTFVDQEVGKVLRELKTLGLSDNTIVVFWSDHGYHLGENGEWCKNTAFELSNWSPLMIHIPGVTDKGIDTLEITEFVDLFPSLVDAAGFQIPPLCPKKSKNVKLCVEGISFLPLIDNPDIPLKSAAFSQAGRSKCIGHTLTTKKYRFTEWVEFNYNKNEANWNNIKANELYDHENDPQENFNVVNDPDYAKDVESLKKLLRDGWRSAMLKHNFVDGSVISFDDVTKETDTPTTSSMVSEQSDQFSNFADDQDDVAPLDTKEAEEDDPDVSDDVEISSTNPEQGENMDENIRTTTDVAERVAMTLKTQRKGNIFDGTFINNKDNNRDSANLNDTSSIYSDRMNSTGYTPESDSNKIAQNSYPKLTKGSLRQGVKAEKASELKPREKCCSMSQTVIISFGVSLFTVLIFIVFVSVKKKLRGSVKKVDYKYKLLLNNEEKPLYT